METLRWPSLRCLLPSSTGSSCNGIRYGTEGFGRRTQSGQRRPGEYLYCLLLKVICLRSIIPTNVRWSRVTLDSYSQSVYPCYVTSSQPLTKQELYDALILMANGKSLGPNGIVTEFFKHFWDLIGDDYYEMVRSSICQGRLPSSMTSGTIALLFKAGDRANLANWRPITLLNSSYKIVAKALQIWLQHFLQDVISPEQSAFLPFRHILGNILLQYETVHWAQESD